MKKRLTPFLSSERGSAAAEHALIVAIIVMGLGAAAWGLVDAISDHMGRARDRIAAAGEAPTDTAALTEAR